MSEYEEIKSAIMAMNGVTNIVYGYSSIVGDNCLFQCNYWNYA
jgi:hypothetical protein